MRNFQRLKSVIQLSILSLGLVMVSHSHARTPAPPQIDAKAFILVDYDSNQVLAAKNEHTRIDPASLTKMMTMYVVDQELKRGNITLEDKVHVSQKAWKAQGSRMFIEVGSEVTVDELVKGIVIQSGNDASIAMAEFIAGTEDAFVSLMNQEAQALGMKNTHFVNSTGMPHPDHYSTAYDLSVLSRALIRDFPETYSWYAEKWFTYEGIKQPNRNRLLWRESFVDGIKTGHSSTAGYCLAASGKQDNMRLISILMGADSDNTRTDYSQRLLRYGFRFFETHKLFSAESAIKEPRVWMGDKDKLALGLNEDIYITVPQGTYDDLQAAVTLDDKLTAPISQGENRGVLTVKLDDQVLLEKPLVALQSIGKGKIWSRFSDYISLKIHGFFDDKETL